ncbi:glutamate--tRNA ligase [Flavobacterium sp. '19STA2R22 D10 B1']|uniref:glutamate--tRNA ligase n=1 Tax=Flavobacterium aerium TaxID=3037261 RepID=UPI00278BD19A|nr:glutamate--tRNA ligase [Flavobacterium sp. '19STA2R22 D10 B1']
MTKRVRVRFAPSPTGPLHIGGVRTALFNYLFAKKHGGDFYLRIEDTDQNRYVPGAEDYIIEALNWCGIPFDEGIGKEGKCGPYRQSERKDLYKQYADQLINNGWAYYAFDTAEALDVLRKEYETAGKTFIYNHTNREELETSIKLSAEDVAERIANGVAYVIRFKTPVDETLHLKDIIRGDIKFETNLLDDKVLFKSDGMPTYHLANIVDDHLMETSHVIRGEEWLPSMPLHVLLYKAFEWEAPEFAHLPLILKPTGNGKLSKRDGDKLGFPVFPLEWKDPNTGEISSGYREKGYLPEAVINMLAFLGWNPGTEQEIFTLEELIASFDLARVNKAGAKFDPEKTKWFNHQYIAKEDNAVLAEKFAPIVLEKGFQKSIEYTTTVVGLVKERATFVSDIWDLSDFFYVAPTVYDEKATKNWKEETPELMRQLIGVLTTISDFTSHTIETTVKEWLTTNEIGMGKVMQPFRLSLVGALKGPHLFDIVELIGKEETVQRIERAIATL